MAKKKKTKNGFYEDEVKTISRTDAKGNQVKDEPKKQTNTAKNTTGSGETSYFQSLQDKYSITKPKQGSGGKITKDDMQQAAKGKTFSGKLQNAAKRIGEAANPIGSTYSDDSKKKTKVGNVISSGQNKTAADMFNAAAFMLNMLSTKQDENSDAAMMFGTAADSLANNKVAKGLNKAWDKASNAMFAEATRLSGMAQKNEQRAKENTNAVTRFLVDAGITGTQLLGDVALNMMQPGAGLAMMGTRTFGGAAREALDSGASQQQAFNYAASAAAVEMLTEKIFDVAKLFGGGAADDWVEKAVGKWAKTPQGMVAMRTLFAAATEGGEEAASDFINPIIRLFYDSDAFKESYGSWSGFSDLLKSAGRDAALGAVLGGFGNIANVGSNAEKNNAIMQQQQANWAAMMKDVRPDMIANVAKAVTPSEGEKAAQNRLDAELAQIPAAEENAAELIAEPNTATQTENPVKAGRATVIKNPYTGEKPQQSEKPTAAVEMSEDSVRAAQEEITEAEGLSASTGKGFKTVLTRFYQKMFQRAENVPVRGMSFAGEKYLVQIGSGVPGKVISDPNLSAEKLALLDFLPDVVENAEYVGSGKFAPKNPSNKNVIRYDYFETDVTIGGKNYIATFDVEVLPGTNNYRTHKIVNVDLIASEASLAGPAPAASSVESNPQEYSLTDTGENVKNQISPEDSTGAAPLGYDPYSNWQNQSDSFHPEGMNAARQVDLSTKNLQGKKTMRGGRSVMEAEATPDQRVREIEQAFVNGKFAYTPQSNDSRVQSATETIERVGWQKAKDDWTAAVRAGKSDADLVAMGAVLFNNAANSGMTAEQFLDLAKDYIQLSHNAGQALQAQRILKTLTPESRLFMMQRSVQDLNEEYKKKLGDKAPDIQIDKQLLQNYLDAKTDAERNAAEEAIQQNIAAQLPSTWMDKWTALRYVNMLGNFKTQARNLLGNTTMGLTAKAKREVLAAMEHVAHIVTGGKYERMTSFVVSPKLYAAARADFENVQKAALGEAKFGDISAANNSQFVREVNDKKRVFKFGVLEAYRKATNWAMEQGDVIFSRANYANTLAGYLKAHGVTAEMMENGTVDQDVLDRGRLYAIKEAQEATFRDTNAFSGWVSQIARKQTTPKAVRAVSEGVLPFRKTPANVLVRGEEYSPLGVVNALVKTFQAKNVNSDVTANDALNQWAKTLTGSAVCAAGFLLAKAGNLIGAKDKNEKQASFDSLTGQQEYSIIINGKSYTIDTFSPTVMPLLVGGTLYDLMEEGGLNPKDIESAITSLADPMINMSMLSGVNDALSNVQFSDNNLIQMALTSAAGYLSQGLTNTLVGQFERTFEGENRMSTYTDEESMLPSWLQKSIGKASAKTPLLDYNQTEYINNWGETESNGNLAERAFNNFLNPSYVSEISTDPVDKELARLHEVLGVTDIYPKSLYDVPDMKLHGKEVELNQAQKENYQKTYGQTAKRQIASLMNTKEYRKMTDAEKAAAVKSILEYATNEGRKKIKADSDDLTWTDKSDGSVAQNAAYRAMYQTAAAMLKNRTGEDSVKDAALVQEVARQNKDFNTTIQIMAQFLSEGMQGRYENAYENGYDFTTAAKLVEAYNEKSYDFGTTDSGNPAGRGKEGTIKWAQENLGLTYAQAVTLWTYMCKK